MRLFNNIDLQIASKNHATSMSLLLSSMYSNLHLYFFKTDDLVNISIPAYEYTCSLASPSDIFWNQSQLTSVLDNHVDALIIALATKR